MNYSVNNNNLIFLNYILPTKIPSVIINNEMKNLIILIAKKNGKIVTGATYNRDAPSPFPIYFPLFFLLSLSLSTSSRLLENNFQINTTGAPTKVPHCVVRALLSI